MTRTVGVQGRLDQDHGGMVTQPTNLSKINPKLTTKTTIKRQPACPPRGGVKDGSNQTDHMETTGMDKDNEKSLQKCGWEKVTTV